jgi:Homeodomain-like domain
MARALDWEAIRDYYDAGHTKSECRDRFGISDWDWHAAVGRGDLIPRVKGNQVGSSDKRALIGRLRSRGLSYSQICRRLGISKATVA